MVTPTLARPPRWTDRRGRASRLAAHDDMQAQATQPHLDGRTSPAVGAKRASYCWGCGVPVRAASGGAGVRINSSSSAGSRVARSTFRLTEALPLRAPRRCASRVRPDGGVPWSAAVEVSQARPDRSPRTKPGSGSRSRRARGPAQTTEHGSEDPVAVAVSPETGVASDRWSSGPVHHEATHLAPRR